VVDVHEERAAALKLCLGLEDGYRVESVILAPEPGDEASGSTLCVSTQVGCRVRCRFCRSGAQGFRRNLETAEIVGQVAEARTRSAIGRVVFMGIGEPLDNTDAVVSSIRILADDVGAAFALRRLVVSTIGRPDGIRRLGEEFEGRVGLAVSLHAADPATRARLVGSRDAPGPDEVLEAVRAYPLPPRQRVTIEVVLARGVNDSEEHAAELAQALRGLRCRVNLIPVNPFGGLDLEAPAEVDVLRYQRRLARSGPPVFVRKRRGARILAGCGQLAFGSPSTDSGKGSDG
jgi:23S rRNA (adenine2503-C2)-methyltransferase